VANGDLDIFAIEQEWDGLRDQADQIEEPWDIAESQ
jgi:hypothetical protein